MRRTGAEADKPMTSTFSSTRDEMKMFCTPIPVSSVLLSCLNSVVNISICSAALSEKASFSAVSVIACVSHRTLLVCVINALANPLPTYSWINIAHSKVCWRMSLITLSSVGFLSRRDCISSTNEYTFSIEAKRSMTFSSLSSWFLTICVLRSVRHEY